MNNKEREHSRKLQETYLPIVNFDSILVEPLRLAVPSAPPVAINSKKGLGRPSRGCFLLHTATQLQLLRCSCDVLRA